MKTIKLINEVSQEDLNLYKAYTKQQLHINIMGAVKPHFIGIQNTFGTARGKHHDINVYFTSYFGDDYVIQSTAHSASHAGKEHAKNYLIGNHYKGGNNTNYEPTIKEYWLNGNGLNEWLNRMTKKELFNIKYYTIDEIEKENVINEIVKVSKGAITAPLLKDLMLPTLYATLRRVKKQYED